MGRMVNKAIVDRAKGIRPGRLKAFVVAIAIAVAAGVAAFKLLRGPTW